MSQEDLMYWSKFGLEPTAAFELKDGRIGLCHARVDVDDVRGRYVRFIAAVVFEKHGPQAFSIYEVPNDLVARVEPYSPKRGATFGDFLRALREGLFGGEKK